jgi:UDP-glucose 4-epimerase
MKIVVTDGAGFIGSHVVDDLFAVGHSPCVVDNLASESRQNLPSDVPFFDVKPKVQLNEGLQKAVDLFPERANG